MRCSQRQRLKPGRSLADQVNPFEPVQRTSQLAAGRRLVIGNQYAHGIVSVTQTPVGVRFSISSEPRTS